MSDKFTDYNLPADAYATFDAESLKKLIIERLSQQKVFSDQVYEGSNLSAFIDIIAYSYHVLIYYLNRTSTETLFSEANIYENVNRIVKLINYNPVGYQTSALSFQAHASDDLVPGTYTLPRYTYVNSNGTIFSLDKDITFNKTTELFEELTSVGSNHLLYQGFWEEHPEMPSTGEPFETKIINTTADKIDHFHVHVYIKDVNTGKFYEYTETTSMFLNKPTDRVFEKRLNEDEKYEIKFGNNITGSQLNAGDTIHVYYLKSTGEESIVGPNFLDDLKLTMYGTNLFNSIRSDTRPENIQYITFDNLETITLTNNTNSTVPQGRESVSEIKRKAPLYFASQNRLVTAAEYETYINKNYGSIVKSTAVVDNNTYMDNHFKYLLDDIGVNHPNLESRVMFNQLDSVSTTTSFNNVYIYCVPKIHANTSAIKYANFLSSSQKELINNDVSKVKMLSHDIVLMDPVYVAADISLHAAGESPSTTQTENTKLKITKDPNSLRDDDAIIEEVTGVFVKYFDNSSCDLGQLVDLGDIGTQILNIDGVKAISTSRTDIDLSISGISMSIWNPVYPSDITTTNQNIQLPHFKFPYLNDVFKFYKKIEITR